LSNYIFFILWLEFRGAQRNWTWDGNCSHILNSTHLWRVKSSLLNIKQFLTRQAAAWRVKSCFRMFSGEIINVKNYRGMLNIFRTKQCWRFFTL